MGIISHTMHLSFPGTCWDKGKAWYPICQLEHALALRMSTIIISKTRNFIDVNSRLQLLHINSVLQVFCLLQTIPYWSHIFTPFISCYVLIMMSGNLPPTPTLTCQDVSQSVQVPLHTSFGASSGTLFNKTFFHPTTYPFLEPFCPPFQLIQNRTSPALAPFSPGQYGPVNNFFVMLRLWDHLIPNKPHYEFHFSSALFLLSGYIQFQ